MNTKNYSFTRYLAAKKSIDDRCINRYVWEQLTLGLPITSLKMPLQVLEVGAGIGTMIERTLERGLLHYARYTALDNQVENIQEARRRLDAWGSAQGMRVKSPSEQLVLTDSQRQVAIVLEPSDVFEFIARQGASQHWDLLIAHAFLDLVDVPAILPDLLGLLKPDGLFYFSLNFDGLTLLEPLLDTQLDELIPALYHRTMDERSVEGKSSGDSRTGRHLFAHLKKTGASVLAAGASDWVVHPIGGSYPEDEAYFLHFIIHTIHQALIGCPELDLARFEAWVAERHAQIERGELVYIAHQIDILGCRRA